jgi:hypothetical protein
MKATIDFSAEMINGHGSQSNWCGSGDFSRLRSPMASVKHSQNSQTVSKIPSSSIKRA